MRAPVLAVGDGALRFWNALNQVFPGTHHQRCWVHRTANCLDSLPKSAQPAANKANQDIYNAEDKEHAAGAVKAFAKHWIHLRTTNPIESTFATVRLRTKVTKVTRVPASEATPWRWSSSSSSPLRPAGEP